MAFENCFKGKKALVTGAGSGIGRAVVAALYARGASVYALSKTQDKLNSLKEEFSGVIPICVNLNDWEETRKALQLLECVDILVNNAGVGVPGDFFSITSEQFDQHMAVNVKAVINVSQVVTKKMIAEGKPGAIVNISSIRGIKPRSRGGVYCSSKAALEMLSKVMAIELGPHKITVNCVNPAMVVTDMHFDWMTKISKEVQLSPEEFRSAALDLVKSRTPTGDPIMPMEDVVNAILFFASGLTSQITGSNLGVDGGYMIA